MSEQSNNYNQVTTEEGSYWCLNSVADFLEVSYDTVYYHVTKKEKIFTPFKRSFEVVITNGKKRDQLFLKVPEAVMELSRCITKHRFSPTMNDIMKLSLDVEKGDCKAISKEGVKKLKDGYNQLKDKYTAAENALTRAKLETIYYMQETMKETNKLWDLKKSLRNAHEWIQEKDKELESLKRQLNETESEMRKIIGRFDTNKEIKSLRKELQEKDVTINSLKNQLIRVREYYKEKLQIMEDKEQGKKLVKNPSLLHFT